MRRAAENRRIESAMNRRLGRPAAAAKAAQMLPSRTGGEPSSYLCKCNHQIDLRGGFDLCPRCGSPLQFVLPLGRSGRTKN